MCLVSDKIKFCTCVDDNIDIESLDHYWILYRYNPNKNVQVMGLALPPVLMDELSYFESQEVIINRINSGAGFDQKFEFKEGDRLELSLNTNDEELMFQFYFEYGGEQWFSAPEGFKPFTLENEFDELAQGHVQDI
jgi:hypothetical protein